MSKIDILMKLQDNYTEMKKYNKELRKNKNLKELKCLKSKFESIKKEYNIDINNIKNIKIKIEKLNKEVENKKQEKDKLEFLLYNEAKSNLKLIDTLQSEIKTNEDIIKGLENEEINLLCEEENLSIKIKHMKNKIVEINNKFYKIKKEKIDSNSKLQKNLDRIKFNIKNLELKLPSKDINKFYELLNDNGCAIAKLKNGICEGCGIEVPLMTLNEMKIKDKTVYCNNCGRILYKVKSDI